ncbi:hypothetical protein [Streptomyces sp. NPDC026673]|uniref:hypothetical protein n=1 Tax=Streptomyces sp. NPDC026673 TaxID=3155724 RepID=UPI0033C8FC02
MPESALTVRSGSGRGCPACGETRCAVPADCLYWLTSRPWGPCADCEGTGWAGELSPCIFCETCVGSGLEEYTPASLPAQGLSDRTQARFIAHIERLRALVPDAVMAVVA